MTDLIDITTPDASLAEDASLGKAAAFEALYRRHAPAAWRVAQAVTGNPEDAADAVSEAFTKVFQALPSGRLQENGQFRPYLLAAVRNAGIDVLRRSGRVRPTERIDLDRPAGGSGPPEIVIDAADGVLVARAFKSLPERWRSVLWLTEVEGIPAREVADLLGVSPNGVAQLAVRARAGLRERFLQAHLAGAEVDKSCRYTVEHLGAYVAGGLAPRDIAKVDQHLAGCGSCRAREEELSDLGSTLRRGAIPIPLVLAALSSAKWHLATHAASPVARAAARIGRAGAWASKAQRPMAMASAGLFAVSVAGVSVLHPDTGASRSATPRRHLATQVAGMQLAREAPAQPTPTATAADASRVRLFRAATAATTTTTSSTTTTVPAEAGPALADAGTTILPLAPGTIMVELPVGQLGVAFDLGPINATIILGALDGTCTGVTIGTSELGTQTVGCTTADGTTYTGAVLSTDGRSITIETTGAPLTLGHPNLDTHIGL